MKKILYLKTAHCRQKTGLTTGDFAISASDGHYLKKMGITLKTGTHREPMDAASPYQSAVIGLEGLARALDRLRRMNLPLLPRVL
jgi:hypothetical protein